MNSFRAINVVEQVLRLLVKNEKIHRLGREQLDYRNDRIVFYIYE